MHEALRHHVLGWWSDRITSHPGLVLTAAVLLAVASVAVTVAKLEFRPNRNDLISERLDWNQRFIAWQDHFPGSYDLYIAVDSYGYDGREDAQRRRQAEQVIDELGQRLAEDPDILDVVWGFPSDEFSPKLVRMLPMEQFRERLAQMAEAAPLLESPTLQQLFQEVSRQMQRQATDMSDEAIVEMMGFFRSLIEAIGQVLATPVDEPVSFAAMIDPEAAMSPWEYLKSENGRLYFMRVTPRLAENVLNALEPAIRATRRHIAAVEAQHPDIPIGLTGIEVVESDETDAATFDSAIASVLAVTGIAILLITAFHSWRTPILIIVSLLIGIAWSFGFLTLVIGHLQVISVVFAVILLGLGVAYGIHLASRFELVRHQHPDTIEGFQAAMRDTLQSTGPGVFTGAVTTAAAFCTTMFTDFTGVAEMGAIAAAGILLCLLAMFSVFPALMRLVKPYHSDVKPMEDRYVHFFEERWVSPFWHHPLLTLAAAALVTLAAGAAVTRMTFDYDLMKLLPKGVDSVDWQERIVRDGGQSIWYGISIVDSEEAAAERVRQFRERAADPDSTIADVGGIGMLFPAQDDEKRQMIRQTRQALAEALAAAKQQADPDETLPDLISQLAGFRLMMGAAALANMGPQLREALSGIQQALDQTIGTARELDADARQRRLDRLQQEYAAFRHQTAQQINAALDEAPLNRNDLPHEIIRSYIADDADGQRLAIEVYPQVPEGVNSPLSPRFLPHFVHEMELVDPHITGVIVQVYRSGDLIRESYLRAGIYALVIVFLLVLVDFYRLDDALLSLVPVAVGFIVCFGLLWLLGQRINPANIIVLPLMFGIGVDAGVHMLHRFRQDPTSRPPGLTQGTGKGITITTFTAMIGFGSLMIAKHRGIASLGFVLALGIGLTLLACWVIVPAWLELRARRKQATSTA